jgi:hypothetical protein
MFSAKTVQNPHKSRVVTLLLRTRAFLGVRFTFNRAHTSLN